MKISQKLPQFSDHAALFVVTGLQEGCFYLAKAGEIDQVDSFKIEKPHYSDREDFARGNGGMVFETGAKFESIKKIKQKDFLKEFKQHLKLVVVKQKNLDFLYLFAPKEVLKEIEASLVASLRKKVKGIFEGNFHKEHPFKLLEKLAV